MGLKPKITNKVKFIQTLNGIVIKENCDKTGLS